MTIAVHYSGHDDHDFGSRITSTDNTIVIHGKNEPLVN